ncbi:hypothetical protein ACFT8P_32810 [Streptomyces sp. NPDC057101]|uniref:hypothetical protein n=1 Tax=Streptomyces sp. NPDC057101 TaxID=3346020 RepID=UPI0036394A71
MGEEPGDHRPTVGRRVRLRTARRAQPATVAESSTADGAKVIQLPAGTGNDQVWGLKRTV